MFLGHSMRDDGGVTFFGSTFGSATDEVMGVWREAAGGLAPVLIEGQHAPGTGPEVVFSDLTRFNLPPAFDPSGYLAFRSPLAGPGVTVDNNSGLWMADPLGNLHLVAQEGQPAPGTAPGVVFDNLSLTLPLVVSGSGQTAFMAALRGTGVNAGNDIGLWADTIDGQLRLIAREGSQFSTGSGSFSLDSILFGDDGLGAKGHIAFVGKRTGSETFGVYVSSAVAVPEPRMQHLLLAAYAFLLLFAGQRTSLYCG
jgi:hypothetical protein